MTKHAHAADVDLSDFGVLDPSSKCKLGRIIDALPDDQCEKLLTALEKKDDADSSKYAVSVERIVTALQGWGYYVSVTIVRTHRRKACACR
jgi:hypothetical protein